MGAIHSDDGMHARIPDEPQPHITDTSHSSNHVYSWVRPLESSGSISAVNSGSSISGVNVVRDSRSSMINNGGSISSGSGDVAQFIAVRMGAKPSRHGQPAPLIQQHPVAPAPPSTPQAFMRSLGKSRSRASMRMSFDSQAFERNSKLPELMATLQSFVTVNRWRLYHVLGRVVHSDDCIINIGYLCEIMACLGGLSQHNPIPLISSPVDFQGDLKPLSPSQLRAAIVRLCGCSPKEEGVDYRDFVEQKMVKGEQEKKLNVERFEAKKRASELGQSGTLSQHQLIALTMNPKPTAVPGSEPRKSHVSKSLIKQPSFVRPKSSSIRQPISSRKLADDTVVQTYRSPLLPPQALASAPSSSSFKRAQIKEEIQAQQRQEVKKILEKFSALNIPMSRQMLEKALLVPQDG